VDRIGSQQVYAHPRLVVREDTLRRPDGSTSTYAVVDGGDIVLIVPIDGDRMHLVEQYRHPVGGRRWEFPSGSVDVGVDADHQAVAARELREETGLVAGRLTALGTLEITPSTLTRRCSVFLATDLAEGPPQREPEEEDMRSEWFSVSEVERMLMDGTLTDAKSVAAYALLLTSRRSAGDGEPSP
jgi:8-oxo-dGDP phosphatase